MPKRLMAAIDISAKVAAIIAEVDGNDFHVLGIGTSYIMGLPLAVNEAVGRAERQARLIMEPAYVGIVGHITSRNTKSTIIPHGDQVAARDVKLALKHLKRDESIGPGWQLLHAIPRQYTIGMSEFPVGLNPLGHPANRLGVEAHMVITEVGTAREAVQCVQGSGVRVRELVWSPIASSEAVLRPEEKKAGVLMASIGKDATSVVIFREGSVWHTSIVPVGGSAETILRTILLEIPGIEWPSLIPAGMVLTGGIDNLPDINLPDTHFPVPVRIGIANVSFGQANCLRNPAYAAAVGLLVWGARREQESGNQSFFSRAGRWLGL